MLKLETLADLDALRKNAIRESSTLEYKASAAVDQRKKDEIVKDISAMANAEGGQIIYGMTEDNHEPAGLDDGVSPAPFDGLWLEQIIQQNISPKIQDLKILLIPRGNGNNAIVVTIPQSNTVHQVKAGIYYRRRNFRNDIMPDYEIREAMNRARIPELNVVPAFPRSTYPAQILVHSVHGGRSDGIELDFMVFNLTSQPAEYAVLVVSLDLNVQVVGNNFLHDLGLETTQHVTLHKYAANLGFPTSPPLFKENPESAGTLVISLPEPEQLRSYVLKTEIRTPGFSQTKAWRLILQPPTLYLREMP
ncbi:MAG: ATP-binding protein [Pseudomonadota bacterium]